MYLQSPANWFKVTRVTKITIIINVLFIWPSIHTPLQSPLTPKVTMITIVTSIHGMLKSVKIYIVTKVTSVTIKKGHFFRKYLWHVSIWAISYLITSITMFLIFLGWKNGLRVTELPQLPRIFIYTTPKIAEVTIVTTIMHRFFLKRDFFWHVSSHV